jgi:exodeoxyribonuclease VII large subunit
MNDTKKTFSVTEINRTIKTILQDRKELKDVWIKGEISNFVIQSSGHVYFSLKDSSSILKCTFFIFNQKNFQPRKLKDGMEILVNGSITLYEKGGTYNLNVQKIEELGKGDIALKIEKLKKDLEERGIFDSSRKRPIPNFFKTLGIVTSPTGAAVQDIIRIAKERYPNLNILVAPCQVQGESAVESIVAAIEELNDPKWEVDVIIAGRGGGSFEDLMAFNQEKVILAYYNSRIPIISAVGHEIDIPLTDFSADLAAPTPTAAAEMIVPDIQDLTNTINSLGDRLGNSLEYKRRSSKEKLDLIIGRRIFTSPKEILTERIQSVDETLTRLNLLGKNYLANKKNELMQFDNINIYIKNLIIKKENLFKLGLGRVENFSPLQTLSRGYSVLRNKKKEVISSPEQIQEGEILEVILKKEKKILVEVKDLNGK